MRYFLLFLFCLLVAGCKDDQPPPATGSGVPNNLSPRFQVVSHGSFDAGEHGYSREVLILTDRETGKEYLVITGASAEHVVTHANKQTQHTQE